MNNTICSIDTGPNGPTGATGTLSSAYGSIFNNGAPVNFTVPASGGVQITTPFTTAGPVLGVTANIGDGLSINAANGGTYLITFDISFMQSDAVSRQWTMNVFINGVGVNSLRERSVLTAATQINAVSASAVFDRFLKSILIVRHEALIN